MSADDVQRIAVSHYYELGYRVAFLLHGYGENSAEERVRLAAIHGWGVRAVGYDPAEGQMTLELAA